MSNSRSLGTCGLWLAINTKSHGLWAYRGAYLSYGGDLTIFLNTWYHFAFTFNADKVQVFLNGKAVSNITDWKSQGTTIDLSNIYIFNSY